MTERSDGSTASYYELPPGAMQLQDLISHRDMNAQIGEIFRACYRMGLVEHSDRLRDAKKTPPPRQRWSGWRNNQRESTPERQGR